MQHLCELLSSDDFSFMWDSVLNILDKVFLCIKYCGENIDNLLEIKKRQCCNFIAIIACSNYQVPPAYSTDLEKQKAAWINLFCCKTVKDVERNQQILFINFQM